LELLVGKYGQAEREREGGGIRGNILSFYIYEIQRVLYNKYINKDLICKVYYDGSL